MILIVEDGTCPAGANSYETLEAADAYLVPRGLWPETPIVVTPGEGDEPSTETPDAEMVKAKKAAMVRAFDWLNALPGGEWMGQPWTGNAQLHGRVKACRCRGGGHVWPLSRPILFPRAVPKAQMELAALIYGGKDLLTPQGRGGAVVAESHSKTEGGVDVIGGDSESHSYTYADDAPGGRLVAFRVSVVGAFFEFGAGAGGRRIQHDQCSEGVACPVSGARICRTVRTVPN